MALHLTSSAFVNGGPIPAQYTDDGDNVSPPLAWTGVPHGAKSLALIVDDPDAPDPNAPKRTWVHWVLYNLPPANGSLPADVKDQLPAGTKQGKNDWGRAGYGGPSPPIGRHRYFFKLFALDAMLPDLGSPTKMKLENEMRGHVMEKTELVGTYEKKK
jgi:Raf kinase inhibitor-like YbhB/YbcL family protein